MGFTGLPDASKFVNEDAEGISVKGFVGVLVTEDPPPLPAGATFIPVLLFVFGAPRVGWPDVALMVDPAGVLGDTPAPLAAGLDDCGD
jgi:hypothetical protein